jgi:putative ABC transport system ATP-binding protein
MLLELMRKMNEEHGVTFILATHEQLVMDHARRLIHLHDGRIVSDDPQR